MVENVGDFSPMNLGFVEELFAKFLADPSSVEPTWQTYFSSLENGDEFSNQPALGPSFRPSSIFAPASLETSAADSSPGVSADNSNASAIADRMVHLQDRVDQLVRAYRIRGHLEAVLDPLGRPRPAQAELDPSFYGFTEEDLQLEFSTSTIQGTGTLTLAGIIEILRHTYCRSIGVQFQHIENREIKRWLEHRMESCQNRIELSRAKQVRILEHLSRAVLFEEFIQKKFQGAKSFSLEGAESLIPLLELAIEKAGDGGVREIVIGMAHRGRLNVLSNIMGKSARDIFHEYADIDPELHVGRGDVKYHLGYSANRQTSHGHDIHLSLSFNPSHLEYVAPVVIGRVRAKQDRLLDHEHRESLALIIHGDAAIAGEGVVQETLNMSQLAGYFVGGTLHVIVNNQIGFTTDTRQARSSAYAADVAKMLQAPIFHVNGEDPEAVAQVVNLAMDFRARYQRDVFIDMYCFRKRGHNEGDEPAFTQPQMYALIRRRKPVRETYMEHLLALGGCTREEADAIMEARRLHLEDELSEAQSEEYQHMRRQNLIEQTLASAGETMHTLDPDKWAGIWSKYTGGRERPERAHIATVEKSTLADLLTRQTIMPEDFVVNSKIERRLQMWQEMARGERPLDWAAAESLAYATLVMSGHRVRISGQDCQRGTFSHRHAVLHDQNSGSTYTPLANLAPDQAPAEFWNSPLSETSILGFDYGYSLDCPEGLVVWEAQFGDFANSAQVIIDQFIVSAEDKWRRLSGIVMLLPHGFEGMGPEHSSARLERFLMLCAEDNIQVVNLTTPAQIYHCLRRQVVRSWRKPLVIMSPKSLLRHPSVVSSLDELAEGQFQKILGDQGARDPQQVNRILLCSGKVYYDLAAYREEKGRDDVAILRFEQLYPLTAGEIEAALVAYRPGVPAHWVQEEPRNMGAWSSLLVRFGATLPGDHPMTPVSRRPAASPATGSASSHRLEQELLIKEAFGSR